LSETLVQFAKDNEKAQLLLREEIRHLREALAAAGPLPATGSGPQAREAAANPEAAVAVPTPCPAPSAPAENSEEATVMALKLVAATPAELFHGMPMLRVVTGPDQDKEFKLPFDRSSIGRASNNRVVLAEERASRVHAELRYEGHRFLLKDAGSTNGTQRNGRSVTEEELEFGDRITIGGTEMLFTCEGFDLKAEDPSRAILALDRTLEREPDFITALQNQAFLLERDVARRRDAEAVWKRLKKLGR
jgi:pSer/pThr/pTyr-binding forkhead associated (FHA) protein